MALREAHSGSTVRNQAGPAGSESPRRGIRGLGKKERGRRRRNEKRAARKAFKVVAGADLRGQVESLAAKLEKQTGVIDAVRAAFEETRQELLAERERVDNFTGFVLPRLGAAAGAAEEVRKHMAEHRAYCAAMLWELRGAMVAGVQCSAGAGSGGVRSGADGAGSESEAMTEVRRLQDDILSIQRAAGSAAAETRRVEMDGNTEIQRLQESVENLSDELEVLRGSTVERQVSSQVLADVRVMMEGSEREQAERLEGIEQLGRSLARRVEGCEANFHSSMAKFQERVSTIERAALWGRALFRGQGDGARLGVEARPEWQERQAWGSMTATGGDGLCRCRAMGATARRSGLGRQTCSRCKVLEGRLSAVECTLGEMLDGDRDR